MGSSLENLVPNDFFVLMHTPDSKVHGANMGPICVRQDPGGPHVSPITIFKFHSLIQLLTYWSVQSHFIYID